MFYFGLIFFIFGKRLKISGAGFKFSLTLPCSSLNGHLFFSGLFSSLFYLLQFFGQICSFLKHSLDGRKLLAAAFNNAQFASLGVEYIFTKIIKRNVHRSRKGKRELN